MNEIIQLIAEMLPTVKFNTDRFGTFTDSQIRQGYIRKDQVSLAIVHRAIPEIPEDTLNMLVSRFKQELGVFIEPETQRIGTGLAQLMSGVLNDAELTIDTFVRMFIRAAAILGPVRVVQILYDWIAGKPYHYDMKIVLTGIKCDEPLMLKSGIKISTLPNTGDELASCLPYILISRGIDYFAFLNQTILTIKCTAKPALYRPKYIEGLSPAWNLKQTWANGEMPCLNSGDEQPWRDRLTEILSLAGNHHISWTYSWCDPGELQAFHNFGVGGYSSRSNSSLVTTVTFQQKHLELAHRLDVARHTCTQPKPLNIAIGRWVSSKQYHATITDRFIDLRIAFEILFLPQRAQSEISFRLALLGAWQLGTDSKERLHYYDLIREIYKLGSKAVHSGEVELTPINKNTLVEARNIRRKTIIKYLKKPKPDDKSLIEKALGI